MKIKAVVLTHVANHKTNVAAIRDTWGKHFNTLFLSDRNEGEDIIGFPEIRAGYMNVWQKYRMYLLQEQLDSDWYIFADDDTFINVVNLSKEIYNMEDDAESYYGHVGVLNENATDDAGCKTGFHLGSIKGNNADLPIRYAGGGAGFFMSKASLSKLVEYIKSEASIPNCMNGDVTFGFWARNAGLAVKDIDGMWWSSPELLGSDEETQKAAKTFHYVTPQRMYELHSKLNTFFK